MKRKLLAIGFGVVLLSLTACSNTTENGSNTLPEATPTSAIQKDDSKFRTGTTVSDAYVDPASIPSVDAAKLKATGYEYDYDKLTYELVWSDEFDVDGKPDTSKWSYETGGSGWGNNELETYTKESNSEVKDGKLIITLRKEDDGRVTSSRMVTRGKGDWTYGKFEIRAKLPEGRGTWPAIWMMPSDSRYGGWPKSGEIDIMEHVGYHQNYVSSSVHTQSYYHKIGTQKTKERLLNGASEDFHTYTLEWLPDMIVTYVDGEKLFEFKPTKYKSQPTADEWPFDQRFFLILNIAWGGDWGGAKGVDEAALPTTMEVDYVRVYQSPEIADCVKARNENIGK